MLKQKKSSPVGDLFITIDGKWIRNISYDEPKNWELLEGTIIEKELFQALTTQLDDYFEGKREHFDLPVLLK